jgi:pyrimidine-specific ribonucleoside hydrolase
MKRSLKLLGVVLLAVMLWPVRVPAHDVYLPVIIDTDAAADDLRAIAMLLNTGSADIRLIVASDGVLAADAARQSVQRLLNCLGYRRIPVVTGVNLPLAAPEFRELNGSLNWPDCGKQAETGANTDGLSASRAIVSAVNAVPDEVLYLCLGPMTNLAASFKTDPGIISKIHRVVYMGGAPDSEAAGWNTQRDTPAAEIVFRSGAPVYALGFPDESLPALADVFPRLCAADSKAADLLETLHDTPAIRERIADRHMKVWDEMTVIYINQMSAFKFAPCTGYPGCFQLTGFDDDAVRQAYVRLLENPADFHLDTRMSVVLNKFPEDPQMMRPDVAPFVDEIITRYGREEWKACLLTNELHRHLGIYSLVGAKMGIRAREILEAPFDTLTVVSFAGLDPPLSCLNDGLQVSTGASLGRGTIRVLEDKKQPAGEFRKGDMVLTLTLKPEYVRRIKTDISAAIDQFGGLGPEYFAHIRRLSISYWKTFDRDKLFDERITCNRP